MVPDPTVRVLELVEHNCDLAPNDIQPDLLPYLRSQDGLRVVITSPGTTYWYLTFNFRDPDLRDIRVRRAIAYAIDREEIIRAYLRGTARLATGMLTPENWAYDGAVTAYPYDPQRARQLLEGAGSGFSGKRKLILVYKCAPEGMRMAEIMQAMLGGSASRCAFAATNGRPSMTTCSAAISISPRCRGSASAIRIITAWCSIRR